MKTSAWRRRTAHFCDFETKREMPWQRVENFYERTGGQRIFADAEHRPSDGAIGKFLDAIGESPRAQVCRRPGGHAGATVA